jgi:hypothetical protein
MLRQCARAAADRLTAELASGDNRAAAQAAIDLAAAFFQDDIPIPGSW